MSSRNAPRLDSELAERVLVAFLRDETKRAGFERLCLGVSGGLDSAVAALLAARADSAPSSRISPRTAMRRRLRLAARVRSAAAIEAGFAL